MSQPSTLNHKRSNRRQILNLLNITWMSWVFIFTMFIVTSSKFNTLQSIDEVGEGPVIQIQYQTPSFIQYDDKLDSMMSELLTENEPTEVVMSIGNTFDEYYFIKDTQVVIQLKSMEAEESEEEVVEDLILASETDAIVDQPHLTQSAGVFQGPSGKETFYNLEMSGVVAIMRSIGYSEEEYPYWIRDDGVKMFGPYVMVAAELGSRPKGTILESSLGTAIVVDTGGFAYSNPSQLDIAVSW